MSLPIFIPMEGDSRPRIVQVMPPRPLMGFIKMTLEDGTVHQTPVRTEAKILNVEFISAYHSAPWDYDNPDEDEVFKRIAPDLGADESR